MNTTAATLAAHHWTAYRIVAELADDMLGEPRDIAHHAYMGMVNEVVGDIWTVVTLLAAADLARAAVYDRHLARCLAVVEEAAALGQHDDGPLTVEVASATTPGVVYTVALDGSRCSCPGFTFRGYCKHVTPATRRAA